MKKVIWVLIAAELVGCASMVKPEREAKFKAKQRCEKLVNEVTGTAFELRKSGKSYRYVLNALDSADYNFTPYINEAFNYPLDWSREKAVQQAGLKCLSNEFVTESFRDSHFYNYQDSRYQYQW